LLGAFALNMVLWGGLAALEVERGCAQVLRETAGADRFSTARARRPLDGQVALVSCGTTAVVDGAASNNDIVRGRLRTGREQCGERSDSQ
jgi:hypothetical protein